MGKRYRRDYSFDREEERIEDKKEETVEVKKDPLKEIKDRLSPKVGEVINCEMVSVRVSPGSVSGSPVPIVAIIPVGEKVSVDLSKSTDDYYAVKTSNLIDGFIKKDFLKLLNFKEV